MATVVQIFPDADANPGFMAAGAPVPALVGAATKWQAMSDSTTASYVSATGNTNIDHAYTVETFTLSPTQRVMRIRCAAEVRKVSGVTSYIRGYVHGYPAGTRTWSTLDNGRPISNTTVYVQAWAWTLPHGTQGTKPSAFTQTEIDGMRLELNHQSGGASTYYNRVYKAWVELEVFEEPVATWNVTSLTAESTQRAQQKWSYVGNGEVQKKYQIKIFTEAQTVAGGFNPDVTTPYWDSGQVTSSSSTATPGIDLALNSNYVSYLKVAKDFNNTDWWMSAWAVSPVYTTVENPTANVLTPTGTITTNTPVVNWGWDDKNTLAVKPQERHQVRLYRRVGASWPAGFPGDGATFDNAVLAGTITKVYDTGMVVAENVFSLNLAGSGLTLANATNYRAYVQVGKIEQDPGYTQLMLSAWDYEEFTTSLVQPPTPLISAVVDSASKTDVLVTVTPQAGTPTTEYYNIYRKLPGEADYSGFHTGGGVSSLQRTFTAPTVFRDTEAPLGILLTYAAESVDTGLGTPVASNLATATVTNTLSQVWLKVPLDPTKNVRVMAETDWLEIAQIRPRTKHLPLGRSKPIMVKSGQPHHVTFAITFMVLGQPTYNALLAALESPYVKFLQTPKDSWYVEVDGDVTESAHLWDDLTQEEDVWRITVPFAEVDSDAIVI